MFAKVWRPVIGVCVGFNFLYLINSAFFFSNVDIGTKSSDYVLLMVLTCFIPMLLSILLIDVEDMTMNRNALGYLAYFLVGVVIGQVFFTVFNDKFVDKHTKTAYIEIQKLLNIRDDVTYTNRQLEFLNDKKANDFEALNKYIKDRDSLAVAGITATSNFLMSMNGNQDPVLQKAFDKIVEDKVVTIQELEDFHKLVINQKMK